MGISSYFMSNEFINCLRPVTTIIESNVEVLEYIIGVSLNYSILFRDGDNLCTEGLNEFVSNVVLEILNEGKFNSRKLDRDVYYLFEDNVYDRFNLSEDDFYGDTKRKLCRYITYQIKERNYMFHAFNGAFLESIKENGINPNISFISQDELDYIDKLFVDNGIDLILGWQKINCNKQCFYSLFPSVSYHYGICSPEWFAHFTGMGVTFSPDDRYVKNAYIMGDYESAKKNLLTLMSYNDFSIDDKLFVIEFFDKCWSMYANNNSYLAIIPSKYHYDLETYANVLINDPYFKNDLSTMIKFCYPRHADDCPTSDVIDVSDAIFIEFPRYNEVLSRLKDNNCKVLNFK